MRRMAVGVLLLIVVGACSTIDQVSSLLPSSSPTPPPTVPGRFVYVTNQSSNNISEFGVAPDGTLQPLGTVPLAGGVGSSGVAADPQGRFLLVALAGGQGGIEVYAIDPLTGLLSDVPGSPFDEGRLASSPTLVAGGRFLWVARGDVHGLDLFGVDGTTGALTANPDASVSTSGAPYASVLRPDGQFLYFATVGPASVLTYAVNQTTGGLTAGGSAIEAPDTVSSLAFDATGVFLYLTTATPFTSNTVFLYRSGVANGGLTSLPGSAFDPGFDFAANDLRPDGVLFHPSGRFAYVPDRPGRAGAFSRGFWAFTFQSSGLLGPTAVGPFSTPPTAPFLIGDPSGFALDPAGKFAYATDATSNSVSSFSIDPGTGALTPLGSPVATGPSPSAIVVVP
ncbi:MAG: lactonase family protein [Vicinamibacteria bacterium]